MSDYSIWVLEYSFVPAVPRGLTIQGAFNQWHEESARLYSHMSRICALSL